MNYTRPPFLVLLVLLFTASGCIVSVSDDDETIRGVGEPVTQGRSFSEFEGVSFALQGNLDIETGEGYSLQVEAQENLMPYINSFVRNGVLHIEADDNINLQPSRPMRFALTVPSLNEVTLAGSGDINVEEMIDAHRVTLTIAGSGDMEIEEVITPELHVSIAGSGDITLSGEGERQEISIAGSGDYEARTFISSVVDVSIAGSGDAFVQANETLVVSIAGSGTVFYLGNPTISTSIVGSGGVNPLSN